MKRYPTTQRGRLLYEAMNGKPPPVPAGTSPEVLNGRSIRAAVPQKHKDAGVSNNS